LHIGSCKGWEYGLGGKSLINDGNHCTIPIPTMCEFGIRGNIFDVNRFSGECSTRSNVFQIEQVNTTRNREDVKLIGFPRVENAYSIIGTSQRKYQRYVRNNIIDMDDPDISQEIKDNIEVTLDISNPEASKLTINVKPNITRAEEQKKLREEIIQKEKEDGTYNTRIDKNVLLIYLDNMSRAHFYRQLPKTVEFLEKFYDNQDEDINSYQFFRFHSSFYNTARTNNGLYYGQVNIVNDTSTSVFGAFDRNGYITGFFKDA